MKDKKLFYKSEQKKIIQISFIVTFGLTLLLFPFAFYNHLDIPLGILLGGLISIFCYLMLIHQVNNTLSYKNPRLRGVLNYLLRWLFYLLGFGISLLLNHFGYNIFNVFCVFGGYFISKIVMIIITLINKKEVDNNEKVQ